MNPQCYQSRDERERRLNFWQDVVSPISSFSPCVCQSVPWTCSLGWTLWHALCMKPLKSLSLEYKTFLKLRAAATVFLSHCKSHKTTKISGRKTFIFVNPFKIMRMNEWTNKQQIAKWQNGFEQYKMYMLLSQIKHTHRERERERESKIKRNICSHCTLKL